MLEQDTVTGTIPSSGEQVSPAVGLAATTISLVAVLVPLAVVSVSETAYVPGSSYTTGGGLGSALVSVFPKSQASVSKSPVDVFVKVTTRPG